jgi:acyl-CoA reductase-like NAD-dependent aldehyde dehydrogenase
LALRDPLAAFENRRIAEEGLLLFAPAWSELVAPAAAALTSALLLGRTVLVVSDPHAPMVAEALVAALGRAGLPGGVLSLVHDDGEDALRAAIGSGAASYTRASGYPRRVRRFERLASIHIHADFGSGVETSPAPTVDLRILRSRSTIVRSSEDPAERAAEIVERSFGRSRSLSGQLPGQIARALCDERILSRFTEALLAELRRSHDVAHPAPLVERESEDHLRRVRVLGLDEGATLIFDGDDLQALSTGGVAAGGADPHRIEPDAAPRSPAAAWDAILSPTVFTNVEERMRLSLLGRPVPLLCLLRVPADQPAEALAERLDRDVPAEDLALDALE